MVKIIKRNGQEVEFDKTKIVNAIKKANAEVDGIHQMNEAQIQAIADKIAAEVEKSTHAVAVEDIQDMVETGIMEMRGYEVAQKYIRYRYLRSLSRKANTTDEAILSLIDMSNEEIKQENSNKNPTIVSVQRDYMAGEVSKDLTKRILLPADVVKAHEEGIIHFHDADYYAQKEHNCDLINLEDMLQNGTCISGTHIDKPKSFATACTVASQIVAQVASSQYGGQTFTLSHLAPFVDVSRKKIAARLTRELAELGIPVSDEKMHELVEDELRKEVESGCQTIQYQLITLQSTNGQAPFVTVFMYLHEVPEGQTRDDLALIIEIMLKQRMLGVKDRTGHYITPAFPKLIYVLQEDNIKKGSKYYYLTELAAKCTAKRMVPDYISEKIMRELKGGDVYPCMGCVDGQEMIVYRLDNKTYMESFERAWNRLSKVFDVKDQPNGSYNKYIDCRNVEIYDTKEGFVPCYGLIRNVQSKWLQVTLQNGRTIRVTDDHPFETENRGIVLAKDLTAEDVIRVNNATKAIETIGTKQIHPDFAWMLGALLCDGCYAGHVSLSLAAEGEDDIAAKFAECANRFFELDTKTIKQDRGPKGIYKDIYLVSDGTYRLQVAISYLNGIFGGKQKVTRHIPEDILEWSKEARISFLAGMIDTDGYVNKTFATNIVQIGSTNKELALGQMYLAQSLGMPVHLYENHYKSNRRDMIRYRVEFVPTEELANALVCKKKRDNCKSLERKHHESLVETAYVRKVEAFDYDNYSYDVTTGSEHFEVSGIYSHNCRSFLTPDRFTDAGLGNMANAGNYDPNVHKYYGRFNQGVVTINLVDVACSSGKDMDKFWEILNERLELCHKALRCRHERLLGTLSDVAPILWQDGALARLQPGETIDKLLYNGYSTISLGYAGLSETVFYMLGVSHTSETGREFGLKVMQALNDACSKWKSQENIDYSVYGTPLESTTYKFAKCLQKRFGMIKDVTDHNYITNSYHINVREKIDAFSKLTKESEFQKLSPGGAISYIEVPNMQNNIPAILAILTHMYNTILYAEINTKSDYCDVCGYDGEIQIVTDPSGKLIWRCPNCGNTDQTKMHVARRTCGYIGTQYWNRATCSV